MRNCSWTQPIPCFSRKCTTTKFASQLHLVVCFCCSHRGLSLLLSLPLSAVAVVGYLVAPRLCVFVCRLSLLLSLRLCVLSLVCRSKSRLWSVVTTVVSCPLLLRFLPLVIVGVVPTVVWCHSLSLLLSPPLSIRYFQSVAIFPQCRPSCLLVLLVSEVVTSFEWMQ